MPVIPVTSLPEFQKIIDRDTVSIFDFWATWCGPCKTISPIFEKLSDTHLDVSFYKVDIDEQADIAQELDIRSMPTFIAFKDGKKLGEVVGAIPNQLTKLIQDNSLKGKSEVPPTTE